MTEKVSMNEVDKLRCFVEEFDSQGNFFISEMALREKEDKDN